LLHPFIRRSLEILWRILAAVALVVGTLYLCDYLSLRFHIPSGRETFGSVQIQRSYAVTMKDKKTEYMFDPPTTQVCVNSLFPHFGNPPCWYAVNHRKQRIEIGP
jgi:hypothetical protein